MLELGVGDAGGAFHEDLTGDRFARAGLVSQRGPIDRNVPPHEQKQPGAPNLFFDDGDAPVAGRCVRPRKKDHADGEIGFVDREAPGAKLACKELAGDLREDAGAVGGQAVGADGAAMGEIGGGLEAEAEEFVRGGAVGAGDKADAATIVFVGRVIEA